MMRILVVLLLLLSTLVGCRVGGSAGRYPMANLPRGAIVTVSYRGSITRGELVVVTDSAVILNVDRQLRRYGYRVLSRLDVENLGSGYSIRGGEVPLGPKLERIRLVSHFPQGLTPDIERRLLATTGQSAIVTMP